MLHKEKNDLPMEAPHTGAFWFSFGAAVDLVTEIKPAGALERLKVHTLRSGPPVPNLGRVSKWFLVLNGVHLLFRSKLPDTANPTRGPTRLRTLLWQEGGPDNGHGEHRQPGLNRSWGPN